jgi:lysylphosphatidylglycerol synthetase-like protein (DUF2156 family)
VLSMTCMLLLVCFSLSCLCLCLFVFRVCFFFTFLSLSRLLCWYNIFALIVYYLAIVALVGFVFVFPHSPSKQYCFSFRHDQPNNSTATVLCIFSILFLSSSQRSTQVVCCLSSRLKPQTRTKSSLPIRSLFLLYRARSRARALSLSLSLSLFLLS